MNDIYLDCKGPLAMGPRMLSIRALFGSILRLSI